MNPHILYNLWRRSLSDADAPIFHWRDHRGRETETLSVGELVAAFSYYAEDLRARGLQPGDRALLVYPPSLDFILAFGGCLWAGILPVPVYPPQPGSAADEERLETLAGIADCRLALTSERFRWMRRLGAIRRLLRGDARRSRLEWKITESKVQIPLTCAGPPAAVGQDSDAFLQFTSGSTSEPKGVRITHANLAHQLRFNRERLGLGRDTRAVLWVPQYHDLGLISGILSALAGNGEAWLMSPLTFLRDPGIWFDVVSEVRGTHTAAPNFAFDFLLDRTTDERRAAWDLSSLRVVMSAAEKIHPRTVHRFLETLAPCGLEPTAFCPAYGLAEHTVGVVLGGREVERRDGGEVQGCGRAGGDIRLRVVDPETLAPLSDGEIGEIWVDSPSKAAGYWGLPELSEETFHARLVGERGAWLRTGDLGFLRDGELFVSGRLKDLIIIEGRNLAPEDLEQAARADARLRPGGIAAFAVDDGRGERAGERAGVLAEVRDPDLSREALEETAAQVMEALQACRPVPTTLYLVAPKSVPRTTSGKVRRAAAREALADGRLRVLHQCDGGKSLHQAPQQAPERTEPPREATKFPQHLGVVGVELQGARS